MNKIGLPVLTFTSSAKAEATPKTSIAKGDATRTGQRLSPYSQLSINKLARSTASK